MASHASDIMNNVLQCLRDSRIFAEVSLGLAAMQSAVPRAHLLDDGQDFFRSDDSAAARWVRLKLRLVVHTRSIESADAITRADDLLQSAVAAILADPYRNGLCQDLPIGLACEVESIDQGNASDKKPRPEIELSATLRFHYESQD